MLQGGFNRAVDIQRVKMFYDPCVERMVRPWM